MSKQVLYRALPNTSPSTHFKWKVQRYVKYDSGAEWGIIDVDFFVDEASAKVFAEQMNAAED